MNWRLIAFRACGAAQFYCNSFRWRAKRSKSKVIESSVRYKYYHCARTSSKQSCITWMNQVFTSCLVLLYHKRKTSLHEKKKKNSGFARCQTNFQNCVRLFISFYDKRQQEFFTILEASRVTKCKSILLIKHHFAIQHDEPKMSPR